MKISSSENIDAPAYFCLVEEGYELTVVDSVCGRSIAIAKKGDIELVGNSMLELLGLAALIGRRENRWKATDAQIEEYKKIFC